MACRSLPRRASPNTSRRRRNDFGWSAMTTDRIARWPAAIAFGVPAAIILCRASPIGPVFLYVTIGIPALLLILAGAAVLATIVAAISARMGRWRRVVSCLVLPVVVLANVPGPFALVRYCNGIGNMIHFEVMRDHYLSKIKSLPDTGEPKLVVINWGGMIWASNGVVYDESDEVVLPPSRRSLGWTTRAGTTELSCEGYSITPMGSHFYLADFPC